MEKKQIDKSSQTSVSISNEPTQEKNKEFQEKKSDVNNPVKNDPTRKDKPPLIISKF